MATGTINGAPVTGEEGWVVLMRSWDGGQWWPVPGTFARTRNRSIDLVTWFDYAEKRRAGEAVAVRAIIQPMCVPETVGDADRRVIYDG